MRIRSVLSHSGQVVLEGALIAMLVVGLMAGTAFAGKGGGHGKPGGGAATGTLAVVMVEDANGNGAPNWNDTITFKVTSTSTSPYVSVRCYQGGKLVYGADAGFYADYPWPGARNMPLSSPSWTGGAASCTALLNSSPVLSFSAGA
jgi:hypothetical protein